MYSIVIIDDHPLMAGATRDLLSEIEEVEKVEVSLNVRQGIEKVQELKPDLVITEYSLKDSDGLEIAAEIAARHAKTKVMFLTRLDVISLLPKILMTNAWGALSKQVSPSALKNAVGCVLSGIMVYPRCSMEMTPGPADVVENLKEEEVRIMKELMKGATYNDIAEVIHMSRRTVDNYTKRIFEKLGAKNKTEAVERFMRTKYY